MIRSLRRRHRGMLLALTLTVPVLFAAGLAVRRPMPTIALPAGLSGPASDPNDALVTQLKNTGTGLALRITTLAPAAGSDARRLAVQSLADPARPELLVYWQAAAVASLRAVTSDSYLLGTLSGDAPVVFPLPRQATDEPGRLIFFSLAQQEVVDTVELRRPAGDGLPDAGQAGSGG